MAVFQIKQDATDPVLAVQLVDSTGSGIDLTNGSHTYFKLSSIPQNLQASPQAQYLHFW